MNKYDRKHWENVRRSMGATQTAFTGMINRVVKLYDRVPTDVPFDINNYPWLRQGIDQELRKLAAELKGGIVNTINQEWALANAKNDAMLSSYVGGRNIPNALMATYTDRNIPALEAFRNRFVGGKDLSERVWGIVKGQAVRMEEHMALGIYEGTPAKTLASEMKQYLNKPDALFRRVRDAKGNLKLSAAAKQYNPGQGVYRSAYKNALRLTRTETNMAYQQADNKRIEKMDFVIGVRVQRSQTDNYDCDICEAGVGDYPKDYAWDSFHPNCLCFQTPILADWDQMEKYIDSSLDGKTYEFKGKVDELPQSFVEFQKEHPNYQHFGH